MIIVLKVLFCQLFCHNDVKYHPIKRNNTNLKCVCIDRILQVSGEAFARLSSKFELIIVYSLF